MPEAVLCDLLRDLGLEPPEGEEGDREWGEWWRRNAAAMTAAQRCRVWQALDVLSFFEVVAVDVEPELMAAAGW
jgi:hypothetical protein